MRKSLLCFLLAALTLAASCGDAGVDSKTTDSEAVSESSESSASGDGLGEHDFGGAEFRIFTRWTTLFYPYLDVAEEASDTLNDAVYRRNRKLEERFNFKFNEECYDKNILGNEAPEKLLLSGDDLYDLYVGRNVNMYNWAADGYFHPIEDLKYIDITKSWWNPELTKELSLCGNQYFAAGAFNISSYDYTHALLFNKEMAKSYQLDDFYELVRSGRWTFDAFAKNARITVSDLNSDSKMDAEDQYGYTSNANQVMPSFWISAGCTSVKKDSDENLVFSAPSDQKFIDVYQKVFSITWDDNIWHRVSIDIRGEEEKELFGQGHALFTGVTCFQISTLRDSVVDFGIIPYPKYDEAQEKYYSRIEGCELFGVPYTNKNVDMTSIILEAMAYESLQRVVPAYYDVTLKVKLTRDNESADMLDIVFENRVFDFGDTLLCPEFRDGIIWEAFAKDNRNAASLLTSSKARIDKRVAEFNSAFSD